MISDVVVWATEDDLRCTTCSDLIKRHTQPDEPIEQREFCTACVNVITHLLIEELDQRLHQEMKRGIPENALRIGGRE